jgi:hypothetical protein
MFGMARKPTRRGLTIQLDRLHSLVVRQKANGLCEVCGGPANQVHHVVGRTARRTRWLVSNGVSIDGGCHMWAEHHPLEFSEWFKKHRLEDFRFLSDPENRRPIQRALGDYLELRAELQAQLDREAA